MEMQCELLVSNFKDPKTIQLVKENIARISDGSASHSGGALKLGLKKAFELKKQKRQPPGVLLRCSYSGCAWYNNAVSCMSVPADGVCGSCRRNWMRCVSCGIDRTGNYPSCQSCGKTFV